MRLFAKKFKTDLVKDRHRGSAFTAKHQRPPLPPSAQQQWKQKKDEQSEQDTVPYEISVSSGSGEDNPAYSELSPRTIVVDESVCISSVDESYVMHAPWCPEVNRDNTSYQYTTMQILPLRGILKKSDDTSTPDQTTCTGIEASDNEYFIDGSRYEPRNACVRFKDDVVIYSEARLRSEGEISHFDSCNTDDGSEEDNSVSSVLVSVR
jgi:hypothetical protein